MITSKASRLHSILLQKCPRCREGNMFVHAPLSARFTVMHPNCPKCGLDFIQEPSFYFGAMYFSYAIQVTVFVIVYLVLRYTINPGTWTYVISMIAAAILILPFNYRWSRVLWINLFIPFQRQLK